MRSCEYRAAAASVKTEGWLGNLAVGGGDVNCGVGGVGVRKLARVSGIWEEGGGVMEDVVLGAGDVNLTRSGEASPDMLAGAAEAERDADACSTLGVSGPASSVVGISESCDG